MICVNCGCIDHDDEAEFCHNCGIELLGNYCTNEYCIMNNGDEKLKVNPTYCYCDVCGEEATFFQKGYIKPVTYKKE